MANFLTYRMKTEPLEGIIKEYAKALRSKHPEENLDWYHATLTRGNAEHDLKKAGYLEGLFLVRASFSIPNGYVLSLIHNGNPQHFQINTSPNSGCFSINHGPPFVGLDQLVRFYMDGPNGLPTKLSFPCIGYSLLQELRQYGKHTIVHQAIKESIDIETLKKILDHPECPNLNIRNPEGRTALQEATIRGMTDVVIELHNHSADVRTRDADGNSALHLACRHNQPQILEILLKHCRAKPQDRCCGSGWVPLHEGCYYGHVKCVETLLKHGAASHPRCKEWQTPLDIARRKDRKTCIALLENHKPPAPRYPVNQWLHQTVDRNKAIELLGNEENGCFLVRISKRNKGQYVLSMVFEKAVYNYEIKIEEKSKRFCIDDGPLFSSLPYLVDYYCRYSDGLPAELTTPIPPHHSVRRPPPSAPNPRGPPNAAQASRMAASPTSLMAAIQNQDSGKPRIIDSNNIIKGRELGQGEFGSVLMGVWNSPDGKQIPVALKTLRGEHINRGESEFQREAEVMMKLNHPCIVKLYGICRSGALMMVQELVAMGSALDYILDYPDAAKLSDFKLWAAQIASGMMYLEETGFVHRDLALRNILLASRTLVKISDFGLSRAIGAGSNYYKASNGGRWPVKWYALESILYGTFSSSSDVWSYGITLWEIFTKGDQPYNDMGGAEVVPFIENGRRLDQPPGCPDKIYEIMLRCWSEKPEDRPTFSQLHSKFRKDPEYFNIAVPGHPH